MGRRGTPPGSSPKFGIWRIVCDTGCVARQIGNFVLKRPLGAGSFAVVWLAHDPVLDDRVAIKVLAENWATNQDIRRRFTEEARILRRIDHERVIRVHAIALTDDDRPYFVMSVADAGTLQERIEESRTNGEGFTIDEALAIGIELVDALAVVHDFGAVHRDIKPTNVLFRVVSQHELADARRAGRPIREDRLVLGDFGLAKDLAIASRITRAAGTPLYMAPEQSEQTGSIDRRADLFSAAAIIFEMLAGQPPFSTQSLAQVGERDHDNLAQQLMMLRPDVPQELADIVARGLAVDPDHRWQTADAMRDELAKIPRSPHCPLSAEPALLQRFRNGTIPLPRPLVAEFEMFLSNIGPARFGLPPTATHDEAVVAAATLTDKWRGLLGSGRIPFRARAACEEFVFEVESVWAELTAHD